VARSTSLNANRDDATRKRCINQIGATRLKLSERGVRLCYGQQSRWRERVKTLQQWQETGVCLLLTVRRQR
jgi:hypothetical protein